jgi:hypothetical protein
MAPWVGYRLEKATGFGWPETLRVPSFYEISIELHEQATDA